MILTIICNQFPNHTFHMDLQTTMLSWKINFGENNAKTENENLYLL